MLLGQISNLPRALNAMKNVAVANTGIVAKNRRLTQNPSLLQGPDKNSVCEEAGAVIGTFSAIGGKSRQKTWNRTAFILFGGATDLIMRSDRMTQFMQ